MKAADKAAADRQPENGHVSQVATDLLKTSEPSPDATDEQISDRARRDLDEQMERLAHLLERVESIEFDREAGAADIFSVQHEPSGPGGNSCAASSEPALREKPAETEIGCEIVLSTGVFAEVAELPHAPRDTPDQSGHLLTSIPQPKPVRSTGTYLAVPQSPRLRNSSLAEPTHGIVQDYRILEAPRQPAICQRTCIPTVRANEPVSPGVGATVRAAETRSRALNILAMCGALLTVAALIYIAADLMSWF